MDVATQGIDTPAEPSTTQFGDTPLYMHDDPEPTISERFMVGDLVKHLLAIMKNQTVTWSEKTEAEQREEVERMQHRVKECVRQAVTIMAAEGCTKIHATVEAVNIKPDGIKATLTVPTSSADRHYLFDAAGQAVLIVLPQYQLALTGEAKPEPPAQLVEAEPAAAAEPDLADQAAA